jgi:hypothetical protein
MPSSKAPFSSGSRRKTPCGSLTSLPLKGISRAFESAKLIFQVPFLKRMWFVKKPWDGVILNAARPGPCTWPEPFLRAKAGRAVVRFEDDLAWSGRDDGGQSDAPSHKLQRNLAAAVAEFKLLMPVPAPAGGKVKGVFAKLRAAFIRIGEG